MDEDMNIKKLSENDKRIGFVRAVTSYANAEQRWKKRADTGLTDDELIEALRYELGEMGGSFGCDDKPNVMHQRSGLKIWVSFDYPNTFSDKPTLHGNATVRMAREVFGIHDPLDEQISLF